MNLYAKFELPSSYSCWDLFVYKNRKTYRPIEGHANIESAIDAELESTYIYSIYFVNFPYFCLCCIQFHIANIPFFWQTSSFEGRKKEHVWI